MSTVAYLVAANPSRKNNLGTLIRCASAFRVEEVVVVGASKWSTHGAHGSHKHVKFRWFRDWESAATFLRLGRGCDLCGIVQASISNRPAASASAKTVVAAVADNTMPPFASPSTATTSCTTPSTATAPSTTPSTATTASATLSTASTASAAACTPPDASEGGVDVDPKPQKAAGMAIGKVLASRQNEDRSEERSGAARERRRGGVGDGAGACTAGCDYSYDSLAVRHRPFRRSTAFLVGHRNRLEAKALAVCDFLVHVEQATDFTIDLGPPVTTSIALHHFTAWANYEERQFEGEKFDVDKNTTRCRPPVHEEKGLAEERLRMREEQQATDPFEAGGGDEVGGGLKWLSGAGDEDVDEEADY